MKLRTIIPHPEIAPFVHHFWVFESETGLPGGDARVVVPNGRHKLIVPYRNGLTVERTSSRASPAQHHGAGDAVAVGLWEEPSIISSTAEYTCTIGVELLPQGLTRIFPLDAHELTQRVVSFADVLGRAGRALGERVASAPSVEHAVAIVQTFLRERAASNRATHPLIASALDLLKASAFRMEVNELEARMGYSRRYLHALFLREVGMAPKRLATVLAFEQMYRRFSRDKSVELLKRDALDLFYDQSHFIRTFRRFTGFAPSKFAELENEFGRIFYVEPGRRSA